jgi:hypothetical protein
MRWLRVFWAGRERVSLSVPLSTNRPGALERAQQPMTARIRVAASIICAA